MTKITAEELVTELHDTGSLSEMFDDMYWSGGFESKAVEEFGIEYAKENDYELVDEENLSAEFYDAYNNTEKGLS